MIMKKLLLTLVALVALSASVSAQSYRVLNRQTTSGKYAWGRYCHLRAKIGDNSGSIGYVNIDVLPNKAVEVRNNTNVSLRMNIKINYSKDNYRYQLETAQSDFIRPNGVWTIPSKAYEDCYTILIEDVRIKDWKRL